jgi:hypothetical protein
MSNSRDGNSAWKIRPEMPVIGTRTDRPKSPKPNGLLIGLLNWDQMMLLRSAEPIAQNGVEI